MRLSHHDPENETTTEVYPTYNETPEGYTYLDAYFLRLTVGRGRGGVTEPSITAEFEPDELYTFAVDILGMIAKESHT